MIMDKEDGTIFTEALELHFINMKAFAKAVAEAEIESLRKRLAEYEAQSIDTPTPSTLI